MPNLSLSRVSIPLVLLGVVILGGSLAGPAPSVAATQSACTQQVATVEQLIGAERAAQMAGEGEGELPVEQIITMLRTCWAEYQGQMPAAETNCALFKQLNPFVVGWSRQVSLLGLDTEFAAEQAQVMPWIVRGLVNCFNEAFDMCVDQYDPDQVSDMVAIERQLALLGAEGEIDQTKYDKCLRFEMRFETALEFIGSQSSNNNLRMHVRAAAPVRSTAGFSLSGGEGPLEYLSFTAVQTSLSERCTALPVTFQATAPFRVLDLRFQRPPRQEGYPLQPVTDITLTFDAGMTRESYGATCPPAPIVCPTVTHEWLTVHCPTPGTVVSEGSHYRVFFDFFHEGERAGGGYTVGGWTMMKGQVLARKTFERSVPWADGLVTRTEKTTLELRHTPVR